MHRRSIVAGLALGAPLAALSSQGGTAQTPEASPAGEGNTYSLVSQVAAMDPADLLASLLATDVGHTQFEMYTDLAVSEWPADDLADFGDSVLGGALLHVAEAETDDRDSVLGAILVLESGAAASTLLDTMRGELAATTAVIPLAVAGAEGFTAVSEDNAGDAYLVVGNVLILATDAFITDGARSRPGPAAYRSTVHAMTTLNHLDKASRLGN
jgi:type IV secretory pathway VirB2 component (pilin)